MQWNNEILAETRMKSAEADEIFAEAQMKLNPSANPTKLDFITK